MTYKRLFATTFLILLILLYMNSFFIPFFGFDFNPAKLLILIFSPILIFGILNKKTKLYTTDVFMGIFIAGGVLKFLYFSDIKYLTSLSNFLLPYLAYKYYQLNLKENINIKAIIYSVLFIALVNCILGLVQFKTGNYFLFEDVHPWKIQYARLYFYNPFKNLILLPHGFFNYSSVLANSLVFPLCIVLTSRKYLNLIIYYSLIILFNITIFLTFSRFDTLSALTVSILFLYYFNFRKKRIFNQKKFVTIFIILLLIVVAFLISKSTVTGTFKARTIRIETLSILFNSMEKVILGGHILDIREKLMMDIPHNIFIYTHYAFGILGFSIMVLFLLKFWYNYKFIKENIHLFYKENNIKLLIGVNFYLFYNIFIRGFDYYVFDGFREIFTIFLCLIFSKILKRNMIKKWIPQEKAGKVTDRIS